MQNKYIYNNFINFSLKRYNSKFNKYNLSPKSLGWGLKNQQITRFNYSTKYLNLNNSSILDIGCGFGDFYEYLIKNKVKLNSYTGIDINNNFIEICKKKFPNTSFEIKDMFSLGKKKYDYIFAFGVFSLKFKGINNLKLIKDFVNKSEYNFKKGLVINYISNQQGSIKPESFVKTFKSNTLMNLFYDKYTNNISFFRSKTKIPFYEETLVLYK